jgi:formylglycine-generating enzyme required for sulfatase activity
MKKVFLKLIVGLCLIAFSALGKDAEKSFTAKDVESNFVKINDSLFVYPTETTNSMYQLFLNALKEANKTAELKTAAINNEGWLNGPVSIESYVTLYSTDPKFKEYPVVNITHEAAVLFCEWYTEMYNAQSGRKYKKVKFHLPTNEEWIAATKPGVEGNLFSTGKSVRNEKGIYLCNYRQTEVKEARIEQTDNADITTPAKSYWPNSIGVYNLSGNVAEMLITKGLSKGGSFKTTVDELEVEAVSSYEGSSSDLGFRVFMDIVEK